MWKVNEIRDGHCDDSVIISIVLYKTSSVEHPMNYNPHTQRVVCKQYFYSTEQYQRTCASGVRSYLNALCFCKQLSHIRLQSSGLKVSLKYLSVS